MYINTYLFIYFLASCLCSLQRKYDEHVRTFDFLPSPNARGWVLLQALTPPAIAFSTLQAVLHILYLQFTLHLSWHLLYMTLRNSFTSFCWLLSSFSAESQNHAFLFSTTLNKINFEVILSWVKLPRWVPPLSLQPNPFPNL